MKIKLGVRGNSDAVNAIIIKMDDLMLVTADNIFLIGEENRNKMGKNIVALLDSLSKEHEIEIGETVVPMIESELTLQEGTLNKFINKE
ncbi:MAG: hypothetical protein CBC02_009775 [Flavobacteriaceae bacterium TMED42]|nr:MAG: hypothetical protein CBC02_009775 [Flavobacteriaceae bacterium TMED42]|tara:strand:- start:1348 stop:1614 length:267 start_codon:yes stop_codon:yes gene_type:complete